MINIWVNEGRSDDKIIAIIDDTIYKCNPRSEEIDDFVRALKMKDIPQKNTFGLPFSYIKEVRHQAGKKYIQLFFRGDSEEHLRIDNEEKLNEIFDCIKDALPYSAYKIDKYSPLRAGKKPLIALLVVIALFIWTLFIAADMESGIEYDVHGGHYNSFAGLVLMFAALGIKKVVLIYTPLLAIAILAFILKARKPPVIRRLMISRLQ
ncbi:hypothetical protein [Puia dinghuensis]|uniref:Uncharacterized protein n=1 Tax=Puia dinghuensis TaxID=1792502 RepID=A0A8J2XWL0_9BACT|nr:hypothetical protein [Puia dinghuensis]GGB24629.1 hypothetical protein GCM10011511_55710 [Puia dinghuensis]